MITFGMTMRLLKMTKALSVVSGPLCSATMKQSRNLPIDVFLHASYSIQALRLKRITTNFQRTTTLLPEYLTVIKIGSTPLIIIQHHLTLLGLLYIQKIARNLDG